MGKGNNFSLMEIVSEEPMTMENLMERVDTIGMMEATTKENLRTDTGKAKVFFMSKVVLSTEVKLLLS